MSLTINDIFPCADQNQRILEPSKCNKYTNFPVIASTTSANLIYRRRTGKAHARIQYEYDDLMAWEYRLIESFFARKKGRYEDFYLVDWTRPYRILATPDPGVEYTLDSVSGLTASSGYIGNTLLLYDPHFDVQKGAGSEDKNILTIDSGGISGTTITVTKNQSGRAQLDTNRSKIYVLVPMIFDTDSLAPSIKNTCIEKNRPYFPGYGNQYLFGYITSVNIPFLSLGVYQE